MNHIEPCMYANCPGHPCNCDNAPPSCGASTDSTFLFLVECTEPEGHSGPHWDNRHDVAWTGNGPMPAVGDDA